MFVSAFVPINLQTILNLFGPWSTTQNQHKSVGISVLNIQIIWNNLNICTLISDKVKQIKMCLNIGIYLTSCVTLWLSIKEETYRNCYYFN